jgi:hypothetical protein
MAKMNTLPYVLILRSVEAVLFFYLKYSNSYTSANFKYVVLILTPLTALVLIATFSGYRKFKKYNPPLKLGFGIMLTFLFALEYYLLFAAPKGHFDFEMSRWMISGIELILAICLRFIRKIELL